MNRATIARSLLVVISLASLVGAPQSARAQAYPFFATDLACAMSQVTRWHIGGLGQPQYAEAMSGIRWDGAGTGGLFEVQVYGVNDPLGFSKDVLARYSVDGQGGLHVVSGLSGGGGSLGPADFISLGLSQTDPILTEPYTALPQPISGGLQPPACGTTPPTPPTPTPTLTPLSGYAQSVVADSPVAYYRLGDAGSVAVNTAVQPGQRILYNGTYRTSVTRGNPGLIWDDPETSAGFSGYSEDAAIQVPQYSVFQPSQNISVEAWVNLSSTETFQALVDYGTINTYPQQPSYSYLLGFNPWLESPSFEFQLAAGALSNPGYTTVQPTGISPANAGATYYVVGTYDGSNAKLYVNSLLVAETPVTGPINYQFANDPSGLGLTIGNDGNLRVGASGFMQEVAVYPFALTAQQVAVHYALGVPRRLPQGSAIPRTGL